MTATRLEPLFLDGTAGRFFCLLRAAPGANRSVLFVPPFAEEMNKCRKQMTITADRLVERGYATFVVDLFGTGDSDGEFEEARWDDWREDLVTAFDWLSENNLPPMALIAVRLGCVLAAEMLNKPARSVERSVFWQPVATGRQFMTQFLRLRVASSMMAGEGNETVDRLRERFGQGEVVAVAGYDVSPELALTIDQADLAARLTRRLGDTCILEIGATQKDELSPGGTRIMRQAEEAGIRTRGMRIMGEPFWTATEVVVNQALADTTADFIDRRLQ